MNGQHNGLFKAPNTYQMNIKKRYQLLTLHFKMRRREITRIGRQAGMFHRSQFWESRILQVIVKTKTKTENKNKRNKEASATV